MCAIYVVLLCVGRFGFGWAHDVFKNLHVICSCIFMHTYLHFLIFLYTTMLVLFWLSLSLSLSFSLHSCVSLLLWHLNANLLRPRTLYVLGHLLPLTLHHLLFGSVMRTLERTSLRIFVDKAFIRNATSFCQNFLTLTYSLSFTIGVGSHFVTSRSLILLWSYKSFTPIYTKLILQYLISSLAFEVHAL